MNYILENYKIDGIECYYTTFSYEQTQTLLTLCEEKNLYISGGTDFHGKNKPNVNIGTGHGDLSIPTNILDSWKSTVELL